MKIILAFLFTLILSTNLYAQNIQKISVFKRDIVDGIEMKYWYYESIDTLKDKSLAILAANVGPSNKHGVIDKNEVHIVNTETSNVLKRIEKIDESDRFFCVQIIKNYVALICYNPDLKPREKIAQVVDLNTFELFSVEYPENIELIDIIEK